MLLRSEAWSFRERLPQFLSLVLAIQASVRRSAEKRGMVRAVLAGLRDGLLSTPRGALQLENSDARN